MTRPASATAWVLHLSDQLRVAVGLQEMLYVMPEEPKTHTVPRTHEYARCVLQWERRLVPLIDLHMYLTGTPAPATPRIVGIVACAASGNGNDTEFGALLMCRAPQRVEVTDQQACALPNEPGRWPAIAVACFRHPAYGPIPILDLPALLRHP